MPQTNYQTRIETPKRKPTRSAQAELQAEQKRKDRTLDKIIGYSSGVASLLFADATAAVLIDGYESLVGIDRLSSQVMDGGADYVAPVALGLAALSLIYGAYRHLSRAYKK